MTWEFSRNGAAKTGNITGKYTLPDTKRLRIQTPSATFVYSLQISGDTMIWIDTNGTRTELKKVE